MEAERLSDEKNRDIELQAWRKSLLEGRERAMLEIVKWRTYMQCNPLPDVTRQSELTTYLTLWRDEVVDAPLSEKSVLNVTEEVNKCHAAELVNNMVQSVIGTYCLYETMWIISRMHISPFPILYHPIALALLGNPP